MSDNHPVCSMCGQRPAYSKDGRTFALCAVCGMERLEALFEEVDDDDGEPDFTLDDQEWEDEYSELSDDRFCPFCGKEFEDFSDYGCSYCSGGSDEFIGVELEPGMIAHVSPDATPEQLETLRQILKKAFEIYEQEVGDRDEQTA